MNAIKIGRIEYKIENVDASKLNAVACELVGPRGGRTAVIRNKNNPQALSAMFARPVPLVELTDGRLLHMDW